MLRFLHSAPFLASFLTVIIAVEAGLRSRGQATFNPALVPGIAHPAYLDLDTGASLAAYEYGNTSSNNLFVFIGGLFDGLFTLPYTPYLGHNLTDWSSVQCLLTSSYSYWGFSSLSRDAYEISDCISYLASYKRNTTGSVGKIVLMGSSTGANDIMWYLTRGNETERRKRYPLDAVILQGAVSDQDYINWYAESQGVEMVRSLRKGQKLADRLIAADTPNEPMPEIYENDIYDSPLTAYRYHSLSTYGGDDDFFSVNTSAAIRATTFGRIHIPTLFLWSGADEYVPPGVNGADVVRAFDQALPAGSRSRFSGVDPGALHAVPEREGREDLIRRVNGFLQEKVVR